MGRYSRSSNRKQRDAKAEHPRSNSRQLPDGKKVRLGKGVRIIEGLEYQAKGFRLHP